MLCARIDDARWYQLEQSCIRIVTAGGMSAMGFYREAMRHRATDPFSDRLAQEFPKLGKNPPTLADMEATETIIRTADSLLQPIASELACAFSILGEETVRPEYQQWLERVLGNQIARKVHKPEVFFGAENNTLRVILDGLDGTANFTRGLPMFCSAVAVLLDDQPRVAALYDPIHNEVYSGTLRGPHDAPSVRATASAWQVASGHVVDLVERAVRREKSDLRQQAIGIHLTRSSNTKLVEFLQSLEALTRASGAVYALNAGSPAMANVARGGLGAFLNNYTYPWDVAPGEVLVRACGGRVTDYQGQAIRYNNYDRVSVIAANKDTYSELLKIIQSNIS